jgi:hypothetical protein
MFKSIKNKIQMAALVAPIYAADTIKITSKGNDFTAL